MTEEYENYDDMEEIARRLMERWEGEEGPPDPDADTSEAEEDPPDPDQDTSHPPGKGREGGPGKKLPDPPKEMPSW